MVPACVDCKHAQSRRITIHGQSNRRVNLIQFLKFKHFASVADEANFKNAYINLVGNLKLTRFFSRKMQN